jgi:hypothetical protein
MSSLNVVSDDNSISPNNHTLNNSNIINDNLIKPEELISEDLLDIFKVSECENSPYTLKREKISTHKRSVKVEKVCPVVFDDIDEIFKNVLGNLNKIFTKIRNLIIPNFYNEYFF